MGVMRPPAVEKARALFTVSGTDNIDAGNTMTDEAVRRMVAESNAPTDREKAILDKYAK